MEIEGRPQRSGQAFFNVPPSGRTGRSFTLLYTQGGKKSVNCAHPIT